MTRAVFREARCAVRGQALPFEEQDLLGLIPEGEWIEPKVAAEAMGMTPDAFRAAYCNPEAPRVVIWQRPGRRGGRRVLVEAGSLRQLIRGGIAVPA